MMAKHDLDSIFLYSDDGLTIIGIRNPDGSITNIDPSASKETQPVLLSDFKSGLGALGNPGESIITDNTTLIAGKPSAKVSFASAGGTLFATYTLPTPVYMGDNPVLAFPAMVDSIEPGHQFANNGSNDFQIWLGTPSGQIRWSTPFRSVESLNNKRPAVMSVWAEGTTFNGGGNFSSATNTNFLYSQPVNQIFLVCAAGAPAATHNVWLGDLTFGLKGKANVTLTFDGQYASQYTIARQILNRHGLIGNFALQTSLVGNGGRCTVSQLNEIYNDGHFIMHHSHLPKTSVGYGLASDWPDSASITDDVKTSMAYRAARGWYRGMEYAVHGYSNSRGTTQARNDIVVKGLKDAGIKGMRMLLVGSYGTLHSTYKEASDNLMIQSPISLSGHTSADIIAVIDRCIAQGKSAVITAHEFVPDSATPAGNQIKISDFDLGMAYLRAKINEGKISNMSFPELSTWYGSF